MLTPSCKCIIKVQSTMVKQNIQTFHNLNLNILTVLISLVHFNNTIIPNDYKCQSICYIGARKEHPAMQF